MKESIYNSFIKVNDGDILLSNILYNNHVLIKSDYLPVVKELLSGDFHKDEKLASILKDGAFLVKDEFNELDYYKYKYLTQLFDPNKLKLILLPTLDCNFGCVYCKQVRQDAFYSDETIERIVKYVRRNIPGKNVLDINWYGGEPLVCKDQLYYLTKKFQDACELFGVQYTSSLCTNASLLTEELINDLPSLGIHSVQITIDGPAEFHNKLRPFKDGSPSYSILCENLEKLVRAEVRPAVYLRVNISDESYGKALQMLNDFSDEVKNHVQLYLRYIITTEAQNNKVFVAEQSEFRYWNIYNGALNRGWNVIPPDLSKLLYDDFKYCVEADNMNYFHIAPDGKLYKCSESFFPLGKEAMGTITKTGEVEYHGLNKFLEMMMKFPYERHCKDCELLPVCNGGCRLNYYKGTSICSQPEKTKHKEYMLKYFFDYKKRKYKYKLDKKNYRVIMLKKPGW